MSKKQIWLGRSIKMEDVIAEARLAFPDAETDAQALTRALFHWFHGREENGKRVALARIEEMLEIILERITANDL